MAQAWYLVAAVGLLLMVPASLADHVPTELRVEDHEIEEPVTPESLPTRFWLEVTVPCSDDEVAVATTQATVVEAPSWASLTASTTTNETTQACHDADDQLVVGLPAQVSVEPGVRAGEQGVIELNVSVTKDHADGNTTRFGPTQAQVSFTVAYLGRYTVDVQEKIKSAGPQQALDYTLVLENLSNGDTRFTFSLVGGAVETDGFKVVVPEPLILEPPGHGRGASAEVPLTVYTPFHNGYVNDVEAIQLQIEAAYAHDTSVNATPSQISVLAKTSGWYVPGPGLVTLLIVGGAAALLARRR